MKRLSRWASRHSRAAVFLLAFCEIVNGFNGILLGANLFGHTPIGWLIAAMALLVGFATYVQLGGEDWNSTPDYGLQRRYLLTAFLGNFLLFCLLGGIWDERLQTSHSSASVLGSRQIIAVRDTLPPADTLHPSNAPTRQPAMLSDSQQASQRTSYILLGLLGIGLTLFVAGLACSIACAGYGFLSILVLAFGLGGIAGSAYFFGRAAQKPLKRRRDMTPDERRRDSRRFWLAWLLTIGVVTVLVLAVSVSNN